LKEYLPFWDVVFVVATVFLCGLVRSKDWRTYTLAIWSASLIIAMPDWLRGSISLVMFVALFSTGIEMTKDLISNLRKVQKSPPLPPQRRS